MQDQNSNPEQGMQQAAPAAQSLMQLIQTATPAQLINNPQVADRFKDLYKVVHGVRDPRMAEAFYTAEKFHFLKLIEDSPNLQQCTNLSKYGIFMDVAVSGLSFDPSMKHLYIVPYNVNVGTKDQPRWEKRAALQISGYGELLLRMLQGQVKYADNPVIVYEGDDFRYGTKGGETILEHMACIPRKSDNIIAAYIKITRHDNSTDYKVMAMEDIQRLRKFSKDANSKAWTDGLAGMVAAKVIKHAFKNYPKVRMGEFTQLQSEVVDQEPDVVPEQRPISYGIPQQQYTLPEAPAGAQYQATMIVSQAVPQPAQQAPELQQGQQFAQQQDDPALAF